VVEGNELLIEELCCDATKDILQTEEEERGGRYKRELLVFGAQVQ
jgi:hypothetical protein